MSRNYEMMYILRPDLSEEQVQQVIDQYRNLLKEYQAEEIEVKIWGKRRLAYPIKKYQDGIYILMDYRADGKQVAPLERAMRLGEDVIRYLTIKLEEKEAVLPEVEEAEAAVEVAA
jgi:small subunit ribosomal protein S6